MTQGWNDIMAEVGRDISIVRGKRRLPNGTVPIVPDAWISVLVARWPLLWGDAKIELPAGWCDLMIALSAYLSATVPAARILDASQDKYDGQLRLLSGKAGELDDAMIAAFCTHAAFTCVVCGQPGRPGGPIGAMQTRCQKHPL